MAKPSYKTARKSRHTASITEIDPNSFTDRDLDPKPAVPKDFTMSPGTAKPGGTISPEQNMPDLPALKRNPSGTIKT